MMSGRTLRLASLVVPSVLAAVSRDVDDQQLVHAVAPVLIFLWVVMIGVLAMRFSERSHANDGGPSAWEAVDILTAQGASLLWLGAGAVIAAGLVQWASLSVIGLLGLGSVYVTAIWSGLVAGGDGPWRRAKVSRKILPALALEGDNLREEVRFEGVRIPAGMRLFATGRAHSHGPVSRYVVGADASGAEIDLESSLGPARRGEHRVRPLAMWLGDVLGLTRTPTVYRGEASYAVMPKPVDVDDVAPLAGVGGDADRTRPAQLPTDGSFRIREYAPGDDTRRIHWVRSLQQDQLIVRLPDEVPLADPHVRLVLDSELRGVDELSCVAPSQLLDALVRVWLGIAGELTKRGTRVTLVTAAGDDVVERVAIPRSREPQRLGARVTWSSIPIASMLKPGVAQIVVSSRPQRVDSEASWVVVPEVAWTGPEEDIPHASWAMLPFPIGSAENRRGRRLRERRRILGVWEQRTAFSQATCWVDWASFSGHYVARPIMGRACLAVIP
jgi:uncharacterized protein (DUF58 family)